MSCRSALLVVAVLAGRVFAAAPDTLTRVYTWPGSDDHPTANGTGFWAWQPERPESAGRPVLLDLRARNEAVAGAAGWVTRRGDRLLLGDGRPVRFWAVNRTGAASLEQLERQARELAQRGVNMIRIHGGASKTLLDFKTGRLDTVNREVIDQMHRAVVAAKRAGIYTFVSNSFFIIELHVKPSHELEGYTAEWLAANPRRDVPFGLVFLNDRLRGAFKGWLREFATAPNPYDPERTPLARDRAVAIFEILNEDNLFFFTFNPANWPPEQRTLAGGKFFRWLAQRYRKSGDVDAAATVRRVVAEWGGSPRPEDRIDAGTLQLASAAEMGDPRAPARRMADQMRFLAEVQREFHVEMTAMLRAEGFGGLVSPSNWTTAHPGLLLDLEYETYRAGDIIDRHAYFAPAIAEEKVKHRIGAGDTFLGFSMLAGPASSPSNVKQVAGYPSAMSEFAWVNYNAAGVEGPVVSAAYFSLVDFDVPVWFALAPQLWSTRLGKWEVSRPGVLGQFPGAALLFRRGDVTEAPVVVREGRTLESIYRREPARINPPKGFDSTRDDPAQRDTKAAAAAAIDPLAMMVGKVEVSFDEDEDLVSPRVAELIDRENSRVTSITGELVTDWRRGLFSVDAARSQAVSGFLRHAGRIELRDVAWESQNAFGSLLAIALDDRPLAASRQILVQVGAVDRLRGFASEPIKVNWQGGEYVAQRVTNPGTGAWEVEPVRATLTLKRAAGRVIDAVALDENGRELAPVAGRVEGEHFVLPLPEQAIYTLIRLRAAD